MKNIKVFLFFILLTGLTLSCDQKEKIAEAGENNAIETEETLSSEEGEDHPNQVAFMQYPNAKKIIEIDERVDPSRVVKSLRWEKQTKDHGSEFIEGNFRPQGERNYYLEDQKLIAFIELADVWIDSNITNYIEKRTLYNDDMPVITQTRKAQDYTQIEFENWKNIATEHHSLEKVNKILNGSGEFQTHFISVIKADNLFILLGENKPQNQERYTTALRIDEMTPFIEDLLYNLDKYKFRPVDIEFTVVGGSNEAEYRVLTDIAWKNK